MRLIDADELKKYSYKTEWNVSVVDISDVDNSPTITPDKIQALMSDYLIYRCEPEKPQGKWINTRPPEMSDNIVCSLCGYDSIASFNYCPNCGAKMINRSN